MKTYKVKKGRHFSFPRRIRFSKQPKVITWVVRFDSNCNYIIKNEDGSVSKDQNDWNKLCGVFFSLFNTRKDTAMMGWKYNIEDDLINLAPYYHIDAGRDMFPPMLQVKREETFTISLEIDYQAKEYRWKMQQDGFNNSHKMKFNHNRKWCSFINFYFGGNQKAPQTMTVNMDLKVEK